MVNGPPRRLQSTCATIAALEARRPIASNATSGLEATALRPLTAPIVASGARRTSAGSAGSDLCVESCIRKLTLANHYSDKS